MLDKKIYKYSTAKNITSVTFQGFEKTFQEKIYVNLPMPLLEYMFLDENISHKEATLWQLLHGKHIFKEGQFKGTQKQL
ncbi:MAG: hypothetical protein HRT87_04140, partial [Legionellales bacterium]|nr:hypothetical protein [Legionellales bacterium]